ncbi:MAG: HIT domain-containing protein [Acidobacteriota bacterium]
MEIVYTPWRLEYVQSPKQAGECVFCRAFTDEPSLENLVVYRDEELAVMLNRYPYTNGHMLVIPRPHVNSLTGLTPSLRASAAEVLTYCEAVLRRLYHAHGINVGLNLGQAAGAGIIDHIHWHILPRWTGDTNFVTVFGNLRVIPEDLADSFARLGGAFPERIR